MKNDWKDCIGIVYKREPIRSKIVIVNEPCLSFEEWRLLYGKKSFWKKLIARWHV